MFPFFTESAKQPSETKTCVMLHMGFRAIHAGADSEYTIHIYILYIYIYIYIPVCFRRRVFREHKPCGEHKPCTCERKRG